MPPPEKDPKPAQSPPGETTGEQVEFTAEQIRTLASFAHINTVADVVDVVTLYEREFNFAGGIRLIRDRIHDRARSIGPEQAPGDLDILTYEVHLVRLYLHQGEFETALSLLMDVQEALEETFKAHPRESAQIGTLLVNSIIVVGQIELARDCAQKFIDLGKACPENLKPELAAFECAMAATNLWLNESHSAEKHILNARILLAQTDPQQTRFLQAWAKLLHAQYYRASDKPINAEPLLNEAASVLSIWDQESGDLWQSYQRAFTTQDYYATHAKHLADSGKVNEANQLLDAGISSIKDDYDFVANCTKLKTTKAEIAFRQGDLQGALDILEGAGAALEKIFPKHPRASIFRAQAHIAGLCAETLGGLESTAAYIRAVESYGGSLPTPDGAPKKLRLPTKLRDAFEAVRKLSGDALSEAIQVQQRVFIDEADRLFSTAEERILANAAGHGDQLTRICCEHIKFLRRVGDKALEEKVFARIGEHQLVHGAVSLALSLSSDSD